MHGLLFRRWWDGTPSALFHPITRKLKVGLSSPPLSISDGKKKSWSGTKTNYFD